MAADSLPPFPAIDWPAVSEHLDVAGEMPFEDPSPYFPPDFVKSWFAEAGFPIDDPVAAYASTILLTCQSRLFASDEFRKDVARPSKYRRRHDGPTAALANVLRDAEEAANNLKSALGELRWQMLHFKLDEIRLTELEHFHALLHGRFLQGQWIRLDAMNGRTGTESYEEFLKCGSVGRKVSSSPTWLEDALHEFGDAIRTAQPIEVPEAHSPTPYSPVQVRNTFIRDVAGLWVVITRTRPQVFGGGSLTDAGNLSPFQIFHQIICGHVAGLLVRMSGRSWHEMSRLDQDTIRSRAADLGLKSLSPSSLQRALRRGQEFPKTGES